MKDLIGPKAWTVMLAAAAFLCTLGSAAFITRCWERKSCVNLPAAAGGIGALIWCVLLLLRSRPIGFPAYLWLAPIPLVGFQLFSLYTGGEQGPVQE